MQSECSNFLKRKLFPSNMEDGRLPPLDQLGTKDRIEACAATLAMQSVKDTEELREEIAWRDNDWMHGGKAPEISFSSETVKKRKLEAEAIAHSEGKPSELDTVRLLQANGIRCEMIPDSKLNDSDNTADRLHRPNIGLPDLADGTEIKTLSGTSSRNTINGYLKNTGRKNGAKRIVIDNSENICLSDEDLQEIILDKCQAFKDGSVYIIRKDKTLRKVR